MKRREILASVLLMRNQMVGEILPLSGILGEQ